MHKLTQEILEQTITKRANATHKGDYGQILIIGGTEQYGGAVLGQAYQRSAQAILHQHMMQVATVTVERRFALQHADDEDPNHIEDRQEEQTGDNGEAV